LTGLLTRVPPDPLEDELREVLGPARGKTRITILIDDDVLAAFRARAEREGKGYQTLINAALRAAIAPEAAPVTMEVLRQVLREELVSR
jgi:plasmid stability protein